MEPAGAPSPVHLSGGKALSQSIGIAKGEGLHEEIPSVAARIESRRILFADIEFLLLLS